jgi:vitamin-K-epoxide reductase (warfarin-sensitive)
MYGNQILFEREVVEIFNSGHSSVKSKFDGSTTGGCLSFELLVCKSQNSVNRWKQHITVDNYIYIQCVRVCGVALMIQKFLSLLIIVGLCLSLYATYVEFRAELDDDYSALCDISATVSCTKVFRSEFGRIFSWLGIVPRLSSLDLPNALYGVVYYVLFATIAKVSYQTKAGKLLLVVLSSSSMAISALLSYLLTVVLREQCIVCFGTYFVNLLIFLSCVLVA